MKVWEKGQTFKFEQVRWITNLLIETGSCYIAVSHQDKVGTYMFEMGDRSLRYVFDFLFSFTLILIFQVFCIEIRLEGIINYGFCCEKKENVGMLVAQL